jgi:hypothetical protein
MNAGADDIEIYAKTDFPGEVVSILSRSIGPLKSDGSSAEGLQIFRFESVSVVLQPSEDGFVSIWVRGSSAWSSCPALGRYLARELRCIVRCDPGCEFPDASPYSSTFLEINGDNESLISWG